MDRFRRAAVATALSGLVVAAGIGYAYAARKPPLTSADLLLVTRGTMNALLEEAVERGGLVDAEEKAEAAIGDALHARGWEVSADIVRQNDFDPRAASFFDVAAGDVRARFRIEGLVDPLAAIRTGERHPIRWDPNHPYELHGNQAILAECLAERYYHTAGDGPDYFARLENRTADPYHYGFEALLSDGSVAPDHVVFESGTYVLDEDHRRTYELP